jgi:hypothetical protein
VSRTAPLAINNLMEVLRLGSICWLHSDRHTRFPVHPAVSFGPSFGASIATSQGK